MRLRNSWQSCSQNGRAQVTQENSGDKDRLSSISPPHKPIPCPAAPQAPTNSQFSHGAGEHLPKAHSLLSVHPQLAARLSSCAHGYFVTQIIWAPPNQAQSKLTFPWFPFGFHSVSLVHFTLSTQYFVPLCSGQIGGSLRAAWISPCRQLCLDLGA